MGDVTKDDLEGPKIDRRTTMKLLGSAGITGAVAGCLGGSGNENTDSTTNETEKGGNDETTAAPEENVQGGSIEVGWALDAIENLDPHLVSLYQQITIFSNIFNGIVKINRNGEIVGDVAKDWTLPDDTTYEFELHDGITFHNGDTLDANAVKWSIERLIDMGSDSPHASKVKPIESVEAPDDHTLRISLTEPTAPFITFLTRGPGRAGTIVNKTAVQEDPDQYNQSPVGSGPFKLEEREQGEYLKLTKFEDYWETDENGTPLPYLDEIKINLIPEPSTMWTAVKTGEIHYTDELPPENARQAESVNSIQLTGTNSGEWNSLSMLCNDPASDEWTEKQSYASGNEEPTDYWEGKDIPTTNKKVRQAVAKAIDRQALVEKAHFGYAETAHSIINPVIDWAYEEKPDNAQEYDPEGAKQLLDEAGYTGEPRFTGRILGTPADKRVMTVLQQQLSQVGIDIELDVQQESSFWDNIYRYNHMFQIYGGGGDIDPWMQWWKQLKTPAEDGSGAWQKNLYSNEEFDQVLEESFATPNQEERRKLVKEAEQIFLEDAPYAMTTFPLTPKGGSTDLKNVGNQVGLSNFHHAYLDN